MKTVASRKRSARGQPTGEVRAGLLPSAVDQLAGPLFASVKKELPGVRLHLVEGASAQLEEQLHEDRLDMVVVLREDEASIRHAYVLARVPFNLVGRREEPLVGRKDVPLAEVLLQRGGGLCDVGDKMND